MMDHTDRHFRYFMRIISPHALLYTEMITTGAIIHGDRERFLEHLDRRTRNDRGNLGAGDASAV